MLPRIAALGLLFVAACSSTTTTTTTAAGGGKQQQQRPARERPVRPAPIAADLPKGAIVKTSREAGFLEMIDDLAGADFVYLGEQHDDPDHHLAQLRIIEHLHARGRLHAIGMEQFQRPFQKVLLDYTAKRIDEAELLEKTGFKQRWGYDYALYRPILQFARKWGIPVLALNVADEIRRKVSGGGLEALSNEERASLPAIDTSNAARKEFLLPAYKAHLKQGEEFDPRKFDRFFLVQCLWEQVMADTVVRWSRRLPQNAQVVVLAGTDHLRDHQGIPAAVQRRAGGVNMTVLPLSIRQSVPPRGVFSRRYADFVWLTGESAKKKP